MLLGNHIVVPFIIYKQTHLFLPALGPPQLFGMKTMLTRYEDEMMILCETIKDKQILTPNLIRAGAFAHKLL